MMRGDARAQSGDAHQHEHMQMPAGGWTFMQDAIVFAEFNHQGGPRGGGFEGGFGADVTFYGVPASPEPMYSKHPVSFHVFFRLRPPAGAMGRCGTCGRHSR